MSSEEKKVVDKVKKRSKRRRIFSIKRKVSKSPRKAGTGKFTTIKTFYFGNGKFYEKASTGDKIIRRSDLEKMIGIAGIKKVEDDPIHYHEFSVL